MFEAARSLAEVKQAKPIGVHDTHGNLIATDAGKAETCRAWFQKQLTCDDEPLDAFDGDPRPLHSPITPAEVEYAAKKLNNGRRPQTQ